mgnify:CR=1 FL=1
MNLEEIPKTDIWTLYEKMRNYNNLVNLYGDTDKNYRMYNGNQWEGLKIDGIEPVSLNFIKPIVKYKLAVIHNNNYAVVYSAENVEETDFKDIANKTCELLNKKARKIWEKDRFDKKLRKFTKDSAINDEGIIYVDYDKEANMPINEVIYKADVGYGNENSDDIQSQPYIIIRQRKSVSEVQELAKNKGLSDDKLEYIVGDNDTSDATGDSAKYEINDNCWFITKIWKEKGQVWFAQSTKYVDIIKPTNTKLSLYPLVHMCWEEKVGYSRGEGEVRQLIPNQIEVNKTIMRRALVAKKTAYPQTVVNTSKIRNPKAINRIGSVIETDSQTVDDVKKIINTTQPAQMSTDVDKLQNDLITITRELAGAGDIATGEVNPESASGRAILAVQNASQMPMNEQLETLKDCVDQLAKIWLDMWKTYAVDGLTVENEVKDTLTGQSTMQLVKISYEILDRLQADVKVDITPKSPFDKYAQEMSIENMLKAGYFNSQKLSELEVYVSLLDDDSSMPKQKMEEAINHMKAVQERISQINSQAQQLEAQASKFIGEQQDITAIGEIGANLYNQANMV